MCSGNSNKERAAHPKLNNNGASDCIACQVHLVFFYLAITIL